MSARSVGDDLVTGSRGDALLIEAGHRVLRLVFEAIGPGLQGFRAVATVAQVVKAERGGNQLRVHDIHRLGGQRVVVDLLWSRLALRSRGIGGRIGDGPAGKRHVTRIEAGDGRKLLVDATRKVVTVRFNDFTERVGFNELPIRLFADKPGDLDECLLCGGTKITRGRSGHVSI